MFSYPCYNFTMSHNEHSGFDYSGQINEIVHSGEMARKAISYIQNISSYSAYPRLVDANSTLNSLFSIGGFIFIVRTYPSADTRSFIEKNVTVIDTNNSAWGCCFDIDEVLGEKRIISDYIQDETIDKLFKYSLLLSAYSIYSKNFYIIKDNDEFADSLFYSIYKNLPKSLAGSVQCIETFSEFVNVDSKFYICRCLDDSDYERFLNLIKRYPTSAVFDFYSSTGFNVEYNFEKMTFSQIALLELFSHPSSDYLNVLDRIAFDNSYLPKEDLQTYYNLILFLTLYEKNPDLLKKVRITDIELIAMKNILKTMEEDF